MDKTITTVFLIIASVITSVMVFNAVYPSVLSSSDALVGRGARIEERMRSQIEVIHAVGELDDTASWQDTNSDGDFDVFVWAKNVGSLHIAAVSRLDIFFGPEGNFMRIPHVDAAGGLYPYWEWSVENDTGWNPTATLKITIHYASVLASDRYFVKVVLPNGLSDSLFFSM